MVNFLWFFYGVVQLWFLYECNLILINNRSKQRQQKFLYMPRWSTFYKKIDSIKFSISNFINKIRINKYMTKLKILLTFVIKLLILMCR